MASCWARVTAPESQKRKVLSVNPQWKPPVMSGSCRAVGRALCMACPLPAGATMEHGSNAPITQAVMAGLGLSFISEHTIGLERSVGRLVKLNVTGTPVNRQWRLVYRTDKRLMPAATAFVEFMDSEGSRLIEAQVGDQASPTSA